MQVRPLLSGWCQWRLALREKMPHMFGLWFPHLPHSKNSLAAGFNKRALTYPLWTQSMVNQARDFSEWPNPSWILSNSLIPKGTETFLLEPWVSSSPSFKVSYLSGDPSVPWAAPNDHSTGQVSGHTDISESRSWVVWCPGGPPLHWKGVRKRNCEIDSGSPQMHPCSLMWRMDERCLHGGRRPRHFLSSQGESSWWHVIVHMTKRRKN